MIFFFGLIFAFIGMARPLYRIRTAEPVHSARAGLFYFDKKENLEAADDEYRSKHAAIVSYDEYTVFKAFSGREKNPLMYVNEFDLSQGFRNPTTIPSKEIFLKAIACAKKTWNRFERISAEMFIGMIALTSAFELKDEVLETFVYNLSRSADIYSPCIKPDLIKKLEECLDRPSTVIKLLICFQLDMDGGSYLINDEKLIVFQNEDEIRASEHYKTHAEAGISISNLNEGVSSDSLELIKQFKSIEITFPLACKDPHLSLFILNDQALKLIAVLPNEKHVIAMNADAWANPYYRKKILELLDLNPSISLGISGLSDKTLCSFMNENLLEYLSKISFFGVSFGSSKANNRVDNDNISRIIFFIRKYLYRAQKVKLAVYPSAHLMLDEILKAFKNMESVEIDFVSDRQECVCYSDFKHTHYSGKDAFKRSLKDAVARVRNIKSLRVLGSYLCNLPR